APAAREVVAGRGVGEATLGQDQPRAGTFGGEGQFHFGGEARLTSEERGHRVGEPVRRLDRGQDPVLGERLAPGRMEAHSPRAPGPQVEAGFDDPVRAVLAVHAEEGVIDGAWRYRIRTFHGQVVVLGHTDGDGPDAGYSSDRRSEVGSALCAGCSA